MIDPLQPVRSAAARLFALFALIWLAACDAVPVPGGGAGPSVNTSKPIPVALLIPSSDGTAGGIARSLDNAARLAIADLDGVKIDLRVYDTAGSPEVAAAAATRAVNEGAKIILGPLFGEAANAAGVAVASSGVNVLSFSNNTTIAGGNVYVLGPTFQNTADRLVGYMVSQGKTEFVSVASDAPAGQVGRAAIASAVARNGGQLVGSHSYGFSQQAIFAATGDVAATVRQTSPDAIVLTADPDTDLPFILTALPEAGVNPATVQYMGLTRWNAAPQILDLPGAQGGVFALPDQDRIAAFNSRYSAAYGSLPHPLAGLAYDGIAIVGALAAQGNSDALGRAALTQGQGFQGTGGIFRLRSDNTNQRSLAVARIEGSGVVIVDPAPRSFGGAGF